MIQSLIYVVAGLLAFTAVACRDMAGGQAVDALQKAKTAAAGAESQMKKRFEQGLQEGTTDEKIKEATGEE